MTDPWGVVGPGFPDTVVTVFQAGDTIINSGGLFIYSGTPGPATLILSITSSTTTADPFGTPVRPSGLTIYGPGNQDIFLGLSPTSGNSELLFLSGAAIEKLAAGLVSAISGAGAAEFLQLAILGPALTTAGLGDSFAIQIASSNQGGTTLAEVLFNYENNAGANSTVLNVNNLGMALFDTAGSGAIGGRTGLSSVGGFLKFASGNDGNTYDTGRLTMITTAPQTINSTGLAQVGNLAANIGPGQYSFRFWVPFNEIAAAGAPSAFVVSSNAGTNTDISFRYTKNGIAPVYATQPFNTAVNGGAMTGAKAMLEIEGTTTFPALEVIGLQMATTVAADTYLIPAGAKLEVCPV